VKAIRLAEAKLGKKFKPIATELMKDLLTTNFRNTPCR
jgi:hypothetical protein